MDTQVQEKELDFQKVWQMFAETRERFAETREQIEATDAKLTRLFAETDARIKETSRQIGALGNRWGQFVEGLVAPAALRMFTERGIPLEETAQRVTKNLNGEHMQIDVRAINSEHVVVIEVKSTLRQEDVRDHLRQLGEFKRFFPRYADRKVVGAVAGIVVDESVEEFASNQGLFVIVQSGDVVEIANDEEFRPRVW